MELGLKNKSSGEDFSVRVGQDEIGAILDLKETAAAGLDVRAKHRVPSWEQVYEKISRHGKVLQALLAPPLTVEFYYQDLLDAAVQAGLRDVPLLLGLLWHSPHGDAQKRPERWDYLEALVEEALISGEEAEAPVAGSDPEQELTPFSLRSLAPEQMGSSFTELFSFLEQRVIMDRKSYDSLITELEEVSSKAADLERQVAEWERRLESPRASTADPGLRFIGDKTAETAQYSRAWAAALGKKTAAPGVTSIQAAIQEFLKDNPDLSERHKVQMLQFCLKNYVDINPENSGLPYREKLEMAAKLARDFLGTPGKAGA